MRNDYRKATILEEMQKDKERIMKMYQKGEIDEKEYKNLLILSGNYWVDGG